MTLPLVEKQAKVVTTRLSSSFVFVSVQNDAIPDVLHELMLFYVVCLNFQLYVVIKHQQKELESCINRWAA